jgi:hypothetical protein
LKEQMEECLFQSGWAKRMRNFVEVSFSFSIGPLCWAGLIVAARKRIYASPGC